MPTTGGTDAGDRLAKVIARAGVCSRRDAEVWIREGRVSVNGAVIRTPAFNVTARDRVSVDGAPLAARSGTRVWLYHKPVGLVVTEKDPEGRPTIFEALAAEGLPRVLTVGRLDINTEGLLLLTNDGGLKRVLELPSTGWLRRYRVRAHGTVTQADLDRLADGVEIEGVRYGPIEATLEREQGANVWLVVALREGKNREVKNVLATLGLTVNRLIRVSYGPFQLGDLPAGAVEVVRSRVLRDQLGRRLAEQSGADFDSEMPEASAPARPRTTAADPSRRVRRALTTEDTAPREDRRRRAGAAGEGRPVKPGPRRDGAAPARGRSAPRAGGRFGTRDDRDDRDDRPPDSRRVHFGDGRPSEAFVPRAPKATRPGRGDEEGRSRRSSPHGGPRRRVPDEGTAPARRNPPRRRDGAPEARRGTGDRPARPGGDRPQRVQQASPRPGTGRAGAEGETPPSRGPSRGGMPRAKTAGDGATRRSDPGTRPRTGSGGNAARPGRRPSSGSGPGRGAQDTRRPRPGHPAGPSGSGRPRRPRPPGK